MIKKIFAILFLPYFTLMVIESCYANNNVKLETREITNVFFNHYTNLSNEPNLIYLKMEYNSYFVSNFQINILNKSMAKSIDPPDPNAGFDSFLSEMTEVRVKSSNDFNSTHLAGTELNSLFKEGFYNDTLSNTVFDWKNSYQAIPNSFTIYNFQKPTIDTVHDLYFEVDLQDGTTFFDTIINVNLNRTYDMRR